MWQRFSTWAFLLVLIACQAQSSQGIPAGYAIPTLSWKYADLRVLNAVENNMPTQEVIAVYTRLVGQNAQVRFDYLDYPVEVDHDLMIFVDTNPAAAINPQDLGSSWDYRITIPAFGGSLIESRIGERKVTGTKLRILRDPERDLLIVTFHAPAVSSHLAGARMWIELAPIDHKGSTNSISPFMWRGSPPERIRVMVALRNIFPASTPAQAIKRWDGAHTGPDSSRHGLRHLLDAVDSSGIPVILTDLKSPAWLDALDLAGGLTRVKSLEKDNLLILPDVFPLDLPENSIGSLPDWFIQTVMDYSLKISKEYGLSSSPMLYTPQVGFGIYKGYSHFLYQSDTDGKRTGVYCFGNDIVSQVDGNVYTQSTHLQTLVDQEGFTREVVGRITQASAQCPSSVILLQDDLSTTYWGNLQSATGALTYLAQHPWMEVLDRYQVPDLAQNRPARYEIPVDEPGESNYPYDEELLVELSRIGFSPLGRIAWKMFFALSSPATQELQAVRANYFGQIGHIIAASRWAEDPRPIYDCTQDLDWDTQAECQLASENFYSVYEPAIASITFAFARSNNEVFQVIGPSYQFATGLSDPSEWDNSKGLFADPGQILAFSENQSLRQLYQASVTPGVITFSTSDGRGIVYRLSARGLEITNHGPGFHQLVVPVILLQPSHLSAIEVHTDARIIHAPFYASLDLLNQPEDPNFEYPLGHNTPIPLDYLWIESQGPYIVELVIR